MLHIHHMISSPAFPSGLDMVIGYANAIDHHIGSPILSGKPRSERRTTACHIWCKFTSLARLRTTQPRWKMEAGIHIVMRSQPYQEKSSTSSGRATLVQQGDGTFIPCMLMESTISTLAQGRSWCCLFGFLSCKISLFIVTDHSI